MFCCKQGKKSECYTKNDIKNRDRVPPLLKKGEGLKRECGKRRKTAADPRLQKEHKARVKTAMSSDKANNQSNAKTANQIDHKRAEWKAAVQFRNNLPEEIATNSTECAAKPNG